MEIFIDFITKKEVYGLLIILIAAYVLNVIFNKVVDKIMSKSKNELNRKRKQTVIELIKNIKKYALIIIALIFILDLY